MAGKVAYSSTALQSRGRLIQALLLSTAISGCAAAPKALYQEFAYADFGPQAMAYQLLGQDQLSFMPDAAMGIGLGEVKVIVFRPPATVESAALRYPADPLSQLDYRYITAEAALSYLARRIDQNLLVKITERLRRTQRRIQTWLVS